MERQRKTGGADRSPLILIVIAVYAAFLVTALASIMLFFPQASLPGSLRPSAVRPAQPAEPQAPAIPGEAPAAKPASAIARLAAAIGSRLAELEWPEIRRPDVAGWTRRTGAAIGAWWRDLPRPDLAALRLRLRGQDEPAPREREPAPPSVAAPPPAAVAVEPSAPEAASVTLTVGAAPSARDAQPPPDVDALRRAYEARLRDSEARHALDLAAARSEAAARYNPVFEQGDLAALLSRGVNRQLFAADVSAPYREVLGREGIATPQQYEQLRERAAEIDALTGRLLEVPFANSVPPALERIREAGQTLALEYGRIWSALADRLQERDERIVRLQTEAEQYALAIDSLTRSTREGGYVLDPRDPQSILLYVSRLHAPRVGDTVYVFRKEDELLATLRITSVGDTVRASLVETGPAGKPITAFDRILLATAEERQG